MTHSLNHKELLWRGDLSPLGCAAALFVSAAHSSGDKSPRHKVCISQRIRINHGACISA